MLHVLGADIIVKLSTKTGESVWVCTINVSKV
jgi:hypothetical protein